MTVQLRKSKAKRTLALLQFLRTKLTAFRRTRGMPRIYAWPASEALEQRQRELAFGPRVHPEEYANFLLVESVLTSSPLRTSSLARANFVFVPLFLTAFEQGLEDASQIVADLKLPSDKRIVIFSSSDYVPRPLATRANPRCPTKIAGPAIRRARNRYYGTNMRWLDDRFVVLTYESTIDLFADDLASFPVVARDMISPRSGRRDLLYSFVGSPRYEVSGRHVRGPRSVRAWSTLIERGGDRTFLGLPDQVPYDRIYRRSVFVLCPAGYARWSFRVSEAISCGAIPVILSDYYVKPFGSRLPWDEFSITIPESDLADVHTILTSLSPPRIRAFQDRLERAQASFTPDGFRDLLIDGLRSRIV
jgi:hypothetical protein